ncbi:MAG: iron-sulfur cluster assembly scaffold protein [Chloroflexota bacterium]
MTAPHLDEAKLMDKNIYREQIIDLYERPLNYGTLDPADFSHEEDNPLCGDVIRIDVCLDGENRVTAVAWSGNGCAISQASASLLTEAIKDMPLDELKTFPKERLLDLIGVPLSMARLKCALLSLKVLHTGANSIPDTHERNA